MKKFLNKLLFPPLHNILIFIPVTVVLMFLEFGIDVLPEAVSYIVYIFSAYSLCVLLIYLIPRIDKAVKKQLSKIPIMNRYINDKLFRAHMSIYISLISNTVFSIVYGVAALKDKSYMQIALAFYNLVFTVMRFMLAVKYSISKKYNKEQKMIFELKTYRTCGIQMFLMSVAMISVTELFISNGKSANGEVITIALAAYTFYCFIISIINIVRYKKENSPIIVASKNVCFARTLMMVFSLQISMFAQFGDLNRYLEKTMNIVIGTVICTLCIGIAFIMIIKANINIKKTQKDEV